MVTRSIKAKLSRVIISIILLIGIALLSFFLNKLTDFYTEKYHKTTQLEKEFSELALREQTSLNDSTLHESLVTDYQKFMRNCQACHAEDRTEPLRVRLDLLNQLFQANITTERSYEKAHTLITTISATIHEIQDPPAGHSAQPPNQTNLSAEPPPDADPTTPIGDKSTCLIHDINRMAVAIQANLFDVACNFMNLRDDNQAPFLTAMKKYYQTVDTIDVHLLALGINANRGHDLRAMGQALEESFASLTSTEKRKTELERALVENKLAFEEIQTMINAQLTAQNKKNHGIINLLQGFSLFFALLLVYWVVLHGNSLIREARKTVNETEKIQKNISYRIDADNTPFAEFRVIFQALNSMAEEIDRYLAELLRAKRETEKRVEERTADLVEANMKLKLEIKERLRIEEEQKMLQFQLRQAHKMEAIGTLAGGIAHDFNNILTAIWGFTELVKEEVKEELPEASPAHRDLEQILVAAKRARDLVKQMLAFSRQVERERLPLKLPIIVKETVKLLRASIPTTIAIRQDIGDRCGTILADPTQIHQLMMNLCTNATHAMEEHGGILGIDLCELDLSEEDALPYTDLKPGKYIKLTISDTGIGMDQATRERIFDPFFTTKEIGKGTGMGLAVVHGIVEGHDGRIYVESEPGKGTVVHTFFPVIDDTAALFEAIDGPLEIPGGNERILFVDDEAALLTLAEKMLSRFGYTATCFNNSPAALAAFRATPQAFDLLITDQTMPQMTGVELAKAVLAERPDLPIILCTGYSEKITEEKAVAAGIRKFALKPLVGLDLAKLVREVLDTPAAPTTDPQ